MKNMLTVRVTIMITHQSLVLRKFDTITGSMDGSGGIVLATTSICHEFAQVHVATPTRLALEVFFGGQGKLHDAVSRQHFGCEAKVFGVDVYAANHGHLLRLRFLPETTKQ